MKRTPGKIAAMLAGAVTAAAGVWVYRDYQKWLALGPGGLPCNFGGWMKTTQMRLRKCDPLDTNLLSDLANAQDVECLTDLPTREGPRPAIGVHPVPHRQLNQLPGQAMKERIESLFDSAVSREGDMVEYRLSYFEKRNRAVTLRRPDAGPSDSLLSRGEIAHVHPSDGSMHMILSRDDARTVIKRGWGELHPLAGTMLDLPPTYLLIYPPRDSEELAVTARILDAAIAHMTLRQDVEAAVSS
ncbi:MAG: hypothetical protein ABL967_01760 [Bryobacteraceae bacterium]